MPRESTWKRKPDGSFLRTDLGVEAVLYDTTTHQAHLLESDSLLLYDALEEHTDENQLSNVVFPQLPPQEARERLQQLLAEFVEKGILLENEVGNATLSRRSFTKAAAAAPFILSILAPTPASAQSLELGSGTVTTANSGSPIVVPAGANSIVFTLNAAGGGGGGSGGRDTTARAAGRGSVGFRGERLVNQTFSVTPGDTVAFFIGFGGGGGTQGQTGTGSGGASMGGAGGIGGSPNSQDGLPGSISGGNTTGGGGGGGGRGGDTYVTLNGITQRTARGGAGGGGGEGAGIGIPGTDAFRTASGAGGASADGGDGGDGSTASDAFTPGGFDAAAAQGGGGGDFTGDPGNPGQSGIATYTFTN